MKKPDEIKNLLECCLKSSDCQDCQCDDECNNIDTVLGAAIALIHDLEAGQPTDQMTLNLYQSIARRTQRDDLTINMRRDHALHLLAAEVGEIHEIYQKSYQGHEIDREKVLDEAGDVLWGLAELMDSLGYTMEDMARHNIDKLKARYPAGFSAERSLNREGEKK